MEVDHPKLLGNAEAVAARLREIRAPHIAPLTSFVEQLRHELSGAGEIPYFDPWDAGVNAEILFLLEAPGPRAIRSGFVSRNNPDETAKNFFELTAAAGLDRKKAIVWNAVPWYIGKGKRIRAASSFDLEAGLRQLPKLLQLLPKLKIIVLVGRKAENAALHIDQTHYVMFKCPHPSPLFVNNAPGNREKILSVLRQVRETIAHNKPLQAPT